jgi:glycosyltransferase involved in cell wall biosynthesis
MRNEERFVGRCLDSVLPQLDALSGAEVLCIDGASMDGTRGIVLGYAAGDSRVRLVDNPARIVPVGMNLAISQAKGEFIMRLDCHAQYAADYVQKCLEVLQRTGADNVGGYMQTLPGSDSPTGRAIAAATSSPIGVGGSTFRTSGPEKEADTVPFGCFKRDVFNRFGLYDERLVRNQDIELNSRIRRGGGKIILSPEIKLTYFNRSTLAGLRQQSFCNGLWNPYTLYLVGGGLQLRHMAPLGFVLSIVVLIGGGFLFRPLWAILAAEMALYLIAVIAASYKAANDIRLWPLTVLAMVQLHLAYGIGSLWGVFSAPFKFGVRKKKAAGALADRRE